MDAFASSSSSQIRRYHVFPSFHGPDVRRGFLSHLHNEFARKGITTFKDQKMESGNTIGPELIKAIRESRVSIVMLSENYASSSWCLDELVEILKCKDALGQIVMTIFYDVDPSHIRKQEGHFGNAFKKTCKGKTDEMKLTWSKALIDVANIKGEHSLNWDNEAEMIKKIAADVSNKLNVTPSKDFDRMVGIKGHLRKAKSCFRQAQMIGIHGPAGIGKTTIARALFDQLSADFPLSFFMGNLKGSHSSIGIDDYDSKLSLQNHLLSNILNQKDIRIHHLGAVKEWLHDQRVLIVLDDVDDLEQLETLAKDPCWFGSGSRIIVTTKDKEILKAHGIEDIYHVDFPSEEEALEILCLSAFKQSSPRDGFRELANKVAELCGNLPLGWVSVLWVRLYMASYRHQKPQEIKLCPGNLVIQNCRRLVSLQGLPPSLWCLDATDCRALKTVFHTFHDPCASLNYRNCVQLDEEARRRIIQQWDYNYVCLPGKEVPMDFTHRVTGNSITIPMGLDGEGAFFSASSRFKACLLLSPVKGYPLFDVTCHLRNKEGLILNEVEYWISGLSPQFLTEHLLIFCGDLFQTDKCHELDVSMSEILFECSFRGNDDKIIECGVQILKEEGESSSSSSSSSEVDCYETGGSRNHYTGGDYEAEDGFKVSQDESMKSSDIQVVGVGLGIWVWGRRR
ncbi:unnamed protein product [Microthlaspi erraticum]|uniref:TIR domain-containing protein n=1 Tax=Microthlaspi erraticum TaxID=1685480 RepID=A0A6D2IG18_9BRAS|nr:unnamed protein product [Microthlaspi erraticum]